METRLAKSEDLNELKEIWRLCFSDPDVYIDLYFRTRDWLHETAVLTVDGNPVSMLTMIPTFLMDGKGGQYSASMIFAVATHPDFQKQGHADRLIEFGNQYLLSLQTPVTLLVPAEDELYQYYGKRGYHNGFSVRETVLSREEIERSADQPAGLCRIEPAEPFEYNDIRRKLLNGQPYLDYRDDEILFQKRVAVTFGTDIYKLEFGESEEILHGCAYAERISQNQIIIKELLAPERYLAVALKEISELLPAEEYIVRMPVSASGISGGTVRPFGMLRANRSCGGSTGIDSCFPSEEYYLGIAYD